MKVAERIVAEATLGDCFELQSSAGQRLLQLARADPHACVAALAACERALLDPLLHGLNSLRFLKEGARGGGEGRDAAFAGCLALVRAWAECAQHSGEPLGPLVEVYVHMHAQNDVHFPHPRVLAGEQLSLWARETDGGNVQDVSGLRAEGGTHARWEEEGSNTHARATAHGKSAFRSTIRDARGYAEVLSEVLESEFERRRATSVPDVEALFGALEVLDIALTKYQKLVDARLEDHRQQGGGQTTRHADAHDGCEELTCVICMDLAPTVTLRACGHRVIPEGPTALASHARECAQFVAHAGTDSRLHSPREGMPLCVLDIDGTLADASWRGDAAEAATAARPGLEEFLRNTNLHFDLGVWSQTPSDVVWTKLHALGLLGRTDVRFVCVLGVEAMCEAVPPQAEAHDSTAQTGHAPACACKPLEVVWAHASLGRSYSRDTSVMVDDNARNFALNASSGIRVGTYHALASEGGRSTDSELFLLQSYLAELATECTGGKQTELAAVDKSRWRLQTKWRLRHQPREARRSV
eukprot:PRCOL_00002191-RA